MQLRSTDGYTTFLHEFAEKVIVVCPSCHGKATVYGYIFPQKSDDVKVVCTSCGFNRMLSRNPTVVVRGLPKKSISGKHLIYGAAIDPFFHLPLYLNEKVMGHVLWAYNELHVQFLSEFVSTHLRERNGKKVTNGSVGSRLPKWMTSKHNRREVLKALDKMMSSVR